MSRRIKKKKSVNTEQNDVQDIEPVYDKNVYDHLKPENRAKEKAAQVAAGNTGSLTPVFAILIIGSLVIAFALSGGFTGDFGGNPSSSNDNPLVNTNSGGFQRVSDMCIGGHTSSLQDHYHATLSIITKGTQRVIPQGIGDGTVQSGEDSDSCMRPIHTHVGEPGRLHVEIPSGYDGVVTLGDFFAIWSKVEGENMQLSSTSLMDQSGTVVLLESNNALIDIENPADYWLTPLAEGDEFITLTLG